MNRNAYNEKKCEYEQLTDNDEPETNGPDVGEKTMTKANSQEEDN